MSKYIDVDCLRAEIDKHQNDVDEISAKHGGKNSFRMGRQMEIDLFRRFITSHQQEQPDFPTTDEEIEMLSATLPKVEVPSKYETPDWLWRKLEQQEVDFEEEWERFEGWVESYDQSDYPTCYEPKQIARHFYELGLNTKK